MKYSFFVFIFLVIHEKFYHLRHASRVELTIRAGQPSLHHAWPNFARFFRANKIAVQHGLNSRWAEVKLPYRAKTLDQSDGPNLARFFQTNKIVAQWGSNSG